MFLVERKRSSNSYRHVRKVESPVIVHSASNLSGYVTDCRDRGLNTASRSDGVANFLEKGSEFGEMCFGGGG